MTPKLFTVHVQPSNDQADAWEDQLLLDALEQGGLHWPSSCRNGTCRTCIGHLVQGSIRYATDWPGLSQEEKEQGCILPCVAYPESDIVLAPCTD